MSQKSKKKKRGTAVVSHAEVRGGGDRVFDVADNLLFAGILLILFLRPFISGRTYPQYNHFFHMGVAFLTALWIVKCLRKGVLELHNRLMTGFVIAFLVVCSLTFFSSVNKGLTLRYIFEILSYSLLFLVIANNLREEGSVKVVVGMLFAATLIICVYGIWQYYRTLETTRRYLEMVMESRNEENLMGIPLGTGILHRLESKRVFATFLYPNAYAMFLVLIGSLAAGWVWDMRRTMVAFAREHLQGALRRNAGTVAGVPEAISSKSGEGAVRKILVRLCLTLWHSGRALLVPLFLVLCVLVLWNLFLTYSRGGWLAALAVIAIFLVMKALRTRRITRGTSAALGIVVLCCAVFFLTKSVPADALSVREMSVVSRLKDSQTIMQRLSYWKAAMVMIVDNPWLGVGWGAFEKAYPKYMVLGGYPVKLAHNNFLQVWAETGIFGLNAFVGLWLVFLYVFWQKVVSKPAAGMAGIACGLGAGIVGFLMNSFIDFALYLPTLAYLIFAFLGLLVAIPVADDEEDKFSFRLPGIAAIIVFLAISFYLVILYKSYMGLQLRNQAESLRNSAFPTNFAQHVGFKSDPQKQRNALHAGVVLLKKSVDLFPLDSDAHHMLGDNYLRLSQMENQPAFLQDAIRQLERAANLDPWSPYVYQSLATAYWTAGNAWGKTELFHRALEAEIRASENFPVNPEFHEKLRQIYEALDLEEEARKEAELAGKLRKHYKEH